MEAEQILEKRISRRAFIKKAIIGASILGASVYGLNILPKEPQRNEISLWNWSKEAYHYTKLGENVKCNVCPNNCILANNERSICRTKVNKDGKLYTLAYGNPCAVHVDPIEKKPLFHVLPSSASFSIATAGCNFRCLGCQNWEISQFSPEETQNASLMPEEVITNALSYNCKSIAYTYSEPTAFYEYMIDTAKLARQNSIKNLWITNGYINTDALNELCNYLDAANVDLKGFNESFYNSNCSGSLEPVLNTLKTLKENNVWFEITHLIIPTLNDNFSEIKEMCKWIKSNIGDNYPLHFSRFNPAYKLTNLPATPENTLTKAKQIAIEEGLKFVYIGNAAVKDASNTYCPKCNKLLIERYGFNVLQNNINNGNCKFCGESIDGIWV